ncbi:hypothetical protein Tco_0538044, partial [Tanacetum coccineum]
MDINVELVFGSINWKIKAGSLRDLEAVVGCVRQNTRKRMRITLSKVPNMVLDDCSVVNMDNLKRPFVRQRTLANKLNASSSSSPLPWANESSDSSPFFQRQLFEALHNVESTIQLRQPVTPTFNTMSFLKAPVLSQGVDELPQVEGAVQVQTSIKAPFMGRNVHVGMPSQFESANKIVAHVY